MSIAELQGLTVAFAVAVAGTSLLERFARRRGLYAQRSGRGAHWRPTPRLGGAAIAAGTFAGLTLAVGAVNESLAVLVAGGTVLLAMGIVDDLRTLPALPRYIVQLTVGAATALVLSPAFTIALPNTAIDVSGWPAVVIVTLWITVIINVFNFMDGIDGLVAGTAAATMPAAMIMGGGVAGALAVGIAGACLGFLVWNHHPASIFMGDGGSQFLGYAVAMAFLIDPETNLQAVPVLLALAPFLIDSSATLTRRAVNLENVFRAHNSHLYQRLVRSGAPQRLVSGAYAGLGLGAGWLAINYVAAPPLVQTAVIGAWAAAWAFVAVTSSDHKRREA